MPDEEQPPLDERDEAEARRVLREMGAGRDRLGVRLGDRRLVALVPWQDYLFGLTNYGELYRVLVNGNDVRFVLLALNLPARE